MIGCGLADELAKDSELRQATSELESQLKLAVSQLSEYKLRCANAESSLDSMANDASRSSGLEKAVKEKNAIIAKLRHDGESSVLGTLTDSSRGHK